MQNMSVFKLLSNPIINPSKIEIIVIYFLDITFSGIRKVRRLQMQSANKYHDTPFTQNTLLTVFPSTKITLTIAKLCIRRNIVK